MRLPNERSFQRGCNRKSLTYDSKYEAKIGAKKVANKWGGKYRAYRCDWCGHWHLTKLYPTPPKKKGKGVKITECDEDCKVCEWDVMGCCFKPNTKPKDKDE